MPAQRVARYKQKNKPRAPGRKKGSLNKIPRDLKEAAIEAATLYGSNGYGKNGLVGWLFRACRDHPVEYLKFLGKIYPAHVLAGAVTAAVDPANQPKAIPPNLTREELISQLRDRGISISAINLDKSQFSSDRNLPPAPTQGEPVYRNGNGNFPKDPVSKDPVSKDPVSKDPKADNG